MNLRKTTSEVNVSNVLSLVSEATSISMIASLIAVRYFLIRSSINQAFRSVQFASENIVGNVGIENQINYSTKQLLHLMEKIKEKIGPVEVVSVN